MSQLSSRLQESERESEDRASELEKKLIQMTKEVELLKVTSTGLLCELPTRKNTEKDVDDVPEHNKQLRGFVVLELEELFPLLCLYRRRVFGSRAPR